MVKIHKNPDIFAAVRCGFIDGADIRQIKITVVAEIRDLTENIKKLKGENEFLERGLAELQTELTQFDEKKHALENSAPVTQ